MTPTPGRGSLDVAVSRVRPADQHDRIGSLVLNPAGAGLSGLGYLPVWVSSLPEALPARFDWWLLRCISWTAPHPVLPIPETITASPVLMIATETDPATLCHGGVALARAFGPSANLLTVLGGGDAW